MDRRLELQTLLETMATNVYFQPPASLQMEYPAIVYHLDDEDALFADNRPYRRQKRYQVTVIDRSPVSTIPDKIGGLSLCSFQRAFIKDNLNHTVYSLYF